MKKVTQAEKILEALRQGPKTAWEIAAAGGTMSPRKRVCDLKGMGYDIESKKAEGERWNIYTLHDHGNGGLPTGRNDSTLF